MSSCRYVWVSRASWKFSFSCINSIFSGTVPPDQHGVAVLFSLRQLMNAVHKLTSALIIRLVMCTEIWDCVSQEYWHSKMNICCCVGMERAVLSSVLAPPLLLIQGAPGSWGKQQCGVKVTKKAEFLGGGRGGTCVHPLFLQCRCSVLLLRLLAAFMAVSTRGLSTPSQAGWTLGAAVSWAQLCCRDNLRFIGALWILHPLPMATLHSVPQCNNLKKRDGNKYKGYYQICSSLFCVALPPFCSFPMILAICCTTQQKICSW